VNFQAETRAKQRLNPLLWLWVLTISMALVLAQTLSVTAQGAPESFADLAERVQPGGGEYHHFHDNCGGNRRAERARRVTF